MPEFPAEFIRPAATVEPKIEKPSPKVEAPQSIVPVEPTPLVVPSEHIPLVVPEKTVEAPKPEPVVEKKIQFQLP